MPVPPDEDAPAELPSALLERIGAAPEVPIPLRLEIGTVVHDTFRIDERLGRGGMGVVYKARDLKLERDVALKLHHLVADHAGRERLLREAKALARLSHPNVITVHEVGTFEGRLFMAMELSGGGSVTRWLEAEERTPRAILAAFADAARGIAATHAAGFVHRDIKPDNILVGDDGWVRVADFGLARLATENEPPGTATPSSQPGPGLTATGAFVGTPAYMAPEQFRGGEVDGRADQFGFCAALFEALYREPAFTGNTLAEIRHAIEAGDIAEPARDVRIPRRVHRLLARGLVTDPSDRYPAMADLADDLDRALAEGRRRWMIAGAIASVVAAGAVFGVAQFAGDEHSDPCASAGDSFELSWSGQRGATQRAFEATGAAYAQRSLATASSFLDAYDRDLRAQGIAACEETRKRGMRSENDLDRRTACLRRAHGRANALIEVLATADATVAANAVWAVAALPRIEHCALAEHLEAQPEPPAEPAMAAEVAERAPALFRALALLDTGRAEDARAIIEPLVTRARSIGHGPLVAEANWLSGAIAGARGDNERAAEELATAFFAAQRSGHDRVAARAASLLAAVIAEDPTRGNQADLWTQLAAVEVSRRWRGTEIQATALSRQARLLQSRGQREEALELRRQAVAVLRGIGRENTPQFAETLADLAVHLADQGESAAAEESHREASALFEQLLGPEHPRARRALDR